jgi:aldose sugar dehydrogenase
MNKQVTLSPRTSSIKKKAALIAVAAFSVVAGFVMYYLQVFNAQSVPSGKLVRNYDYANSSQDNAIPFDVVPVAEGLKVPWGIAFTSSTRMLVTERPGRVRLVLDGTLQSDPLHVFDEVKTSGEEGLMGLAVDPDYATNKYLYFAYAYGDSKKLQTKIVRMTDIGNSLVGAVTLIDNIPASAYHCGGRIAFGPDKKLYVTTGDATNKDLPQDLNSLGGKLLRMNSDGSVPTDNPFPNSYIYSYGHRNSQGIAWDSRTGALLSTEHGPSLVDGPAGGDEFNEVKRGANYGWPKVSHGRVLEGAENELLLFTPAVAPGGLAFYTGKELPQFTNTFLFAGLLTKGIYQVRTSTDNPVRYINYQKVAGVDVGRVRDVVQGPDGYVYIASSNTDGRGNPSPNDDKIYVLKPRK